jgi:UDP-3-O-[3-hydroxymyristoyl] glucosamine N-acyltransferase
MRHPKLTLSTLCGALGITCPDSHAEMNLQGIAPLDEAGSDELSFLANPKYAEQANASAAGVILVDEKSELAHSKALLLRVPNPYLAFAQALVFLETQFFQPVDQRIQCTIDPSASIDPTAILGAGCIIEAHCTIGAHTYIGPGVKILRDSKIGNHVRIEAGAVIGSDGFGYAPDHNGHYHRIPQLGNVVLEDHVSIGANTTVDRAALGSTTIETWAKIDNLCQIAHNVRIGAHSVLAAQVGVAGSTTIGKHCMIGGQVGIVGHITIGDHVKIVAQSGVMSDIPSNKTIFGSPALDKRHFLKSYAAFKKQGE